MYYTLKTRCDDDVVGHVVTQIDYLNSEYAFKIPSFEFVSIPLLKAKLNRRAKMTDVMDGGCICACGLVISERMKQLFDQFNIIPEHKYYPIEVSAKSGVFSYYYLQLLNDKFVNKNIDIPNTTFYWSNLSLTKTYGTVKIGSIEDMDKLRKTCPETNRFIQAKQVVASRNFDGNLDVFGLNSITPIGGIIISERLKNAIEANGLTGMHIIPLPDLFANGEDIKPADDMPKVTVPQIESMDETPKRELRTYEVPSCANGILEDVMYYTLETRCDDDVVGHALFQMDYINSNDAFKITPVEFVTIPLLKAKLNRRAKLTDVMDGGCIAACGLVISERMKQLFDQFNIIPQHKYYPIEVSSKSGVFSYYYLQLRNDEFVDKNIDFQKTTFYWSDLYLTETYGTVEVSSIEDLRKQRRACPDINRFIKAKQVVASKDFDAGLDVFSLDFITANGGLIISERLKNAIEANGLTGMHIIPLPDLFANGEDIKPADDMPKVTVPQIESMDETPKRELRTYEVPSCANGILEDVRCDDAERVIVPDGVEEIGSNAFLCCSRHLRELILPDSVKRIGELVFTGCDMLESVRLPEGMEEIPESLFCNCKSLKRIVLPRSVKKIEEYAFAYCISLEEIILNEGLETIGDNAFEDCQYLDKVVLPSTLKSIGDFSFLNCVALNDMEIPQSVESIGESALFGSNVFTEKFINGVTERFGELPFEEYYD